MKQHILWFIIFSLSVSPMLPAGNGGSGYSRYGIGDVRYTFSERAIGMANSGLAALSSTSIDQYNPAAWSGINRTRFSVGVQYEGFNTTDGANSAYLSGTGFGGFMLAIPVYTTSGIVFGTGITPYSSVNYNISSTSSYGSLLYNVKYAGEGGLSEGHLGLSYIPGNDFSLGAKFSYYFGTMRHNVSQSFSTSEYSNASETRSMEAHGIGATIGIIYSGLGKALNIDSSRTLSVGLVLSSSSSLKATEKHYYAFTSTSNQVTIRDTTVFPGTTLTLPLRLGFGAAYSTKEFLVASDLLYQQWSSFNGTGVVLGNFTNSSRFSIGGEIFPHHEGTASFFQRLAYRAGFFYDASYYNINGESINELGFTGGFGIPVVSDTRLNIGIGYSFRGTTNNGLQQDKIFRLSFSLNGSERWFLPSEDE
ncbi:MAG: hypothetical protein EPO24_11605 [Bacteroidetes bacterium]|nr:MAG: hypothetical protein EPO24_11605 [Bacteroidota bacterium]